MASNGSRRLPVRLSRRAKAVVATVVTVMASPVVPKTLAEFTGFFDLSIAAVVGYQLLVGPKPPILGLRLSVLLAGFVVYLYLPDIYLGRLSSLATDRGIRALSSLFTMYFMLVVGSNLEVYPSQVTWGFDLTGYWSVVGALFIGTFGAIGIVTAYFRFIRRESVYGPDGAIYTALRETTFTNRSASQEFEVLESLSQPTQAFLKLINESTGSVVLVAPPIGMGIVLAALEGLYPVPQLIFLGALLFSTATPSSARPSFPDEGDLDREFLNAITDTFQNLKGFILALL